MRVEGSSAPHIVGHFDRRRHSPILAIEHPKRLAQRRVVATWTKPDAYFRRMFGSQGHLLRLGPSAYVSGDTLYLYPSWWSP